MLLILLAAALVVPPGLDARHIPQGNPLGDMPIRAVPGESAHVLQMPLTEAQWLAERRRAIARSMKNPRMRAIARWVERNDREEAAREAAERRATPDPH